MNKDTNHLLNCTHEIEPKEGCLNIGDGFQMSVYSGGEWKRVSLWARLRWLLLGKMSNA